MGDCGAQMLTGFGLGITTMAVVWAFNKLRSRYFVRAGFTELKREDLEREKRIAEAKKQIDKANKVLEDLTTKEVIVEPIQKVKRVIKPKVEVVTPEITAPEVKPEIKKVPKVQKIKME